jgi:hypothetical protein
MMIEFFILMLLLMYFWTTVLIKFIPTMLTHWTINSFPFAVTGQATFTCNALLMKVMILLRFQKEHLTSIITFSLWIFQGLWPMHLIMMLFNLASLAAHWYLIKVSWVVGLWKSAWIHCVVLLNKRSPAFHLFPITIPWQTCFTLVGLILRFFQH